MNDKEMASMRNRIRRNDLKAERRQLELSKMPDWEFEKVELPDCWNIPGSVEDLTAWNDWLYDREAIPIMKEQAYRYLFDLFEDYDRIKEFCNWALLRIDIELGDAQSPISFQTPPIPWEGRPLADVHGGEAR